MQQRLDKNINGKKVSILGAARSGIAAARLLKTKGAEVFVSDNAPTEKLRTAIQGLKTLDVQFETNGHTERVLDTDIIVISPGIPSDIWVIEEGLKRNIPIFSELEIASWFCRAPIVAVTGTNGKTTTTTLIGKILEDAGIKNIVGGNIGNAFSSFVDCLDENSVAVLEVSSFQLDFIQTFKPKVSVILNITPDHLDRYDHNFEKYIASKCRIFENQTLDDYAIYNYDDEETQEQIRRFASLHVTILPFAIERRYNEGAFIENDNIITIIDGKRSEIINKNQIYIRGMHNLYNSMAAILASQLMGVTPSVISQTLRTFTGVEHRLEFVREINGVKYINDSKATNVNSVWYAIQAFEQPIILILGGRDKGNDYSALNELVKKQVKTIIAIGESANKVNDAFKNITSVIKASNMDEAIRTANNIAVFGDIVLLSPACASFDWFENYEHRGKIFKQIVNSL